MFIVNVNFCIFQFHFLDNPERDAPRSETLVAGLGSILAILPPERTCVCRLCHGRSIQLDQTHRFETGLFAPTHMCARRRRMSSSVSRFASIFILIVAAEGKDAIHSQLLVDPLDHRILEVCSLTTLPVFIFGFKDIVGQRISSPAQIRCQK